MYGVVFQVLRINRMPLPSPPPSLVLGETDDRQVKVTHDIP